MEGGFTLFNKKIFLKVNIKLIDVTGDIVEFVRL